MVKHWISVVCVVALSMAVPRPAFAQAGRTPEPEGSRRPYRGIFGGPVDPSAPQTLVFSASAYGAYDDNVLAGISEGRIPNSWMQGRGTYWGTRAGLDYNLLKSGPRVSFATNSNAQVHYRATGVSEATPYFSGAARLDIRLTRSTTLGVSQVLSYLPNYNPMVPTIGTGAFPSAITTDLGGIPDPDLDVFALQTLRTGTGVTLAQRLGRDTVLSADYGFRTLDIDETAITEGQRSRFRDYRAHTGALGFLHTRRISPSAMLVLGYAVRVTDRDGVTSEPRVLHNVNAGVNYSRALSFSRRTSLRFGTGSAIVVTENLNRPEARSRTRVRLLGNADLVHEMGRSWTAQLSYARGLMSRDGFEDLYFIDAVTATVQGLITRRLSLAGNAVISVSTLDRPGLNRHNRRSASAQATFALTRFFGLYTRYIYYQYEYGADIPLDPRFARALERQAVRVGITTSVPLIR